MAVRKKKDSETGQPKEPANEPAKKKSTTKKRAATKTAAAPAKKRTTKKSRAKAALEELQAVGADIIPSVTIEAEAGAIEPPAVHEHTIDQIETVADDRPESLLTDWDIHLFNEGTHHKLWEKLGSHIVPGGVIFGVWAPNAERVSVVGDFNDWNRESHPLRAREGSGIWEGFIPDLGRGATYKYHIVSRGHGYRVDKADPMAVHHEMPPATASKVWDLD